MNILHKYILDIKILAVPHTGDGQSGKQKLLRRVWRLQRPRPTGPSKVSIAGRSVVLELMHEKISCASPRTHIHPTLWEVVRIINPPLFFGQIRRHRHITEQAV